MANELTTVFVPLIEESVMGNYATTDFQLSSRPDDPGLDISFTPQTPDDQKVFMVAPGEVFFIAAGATFSPANGPEVSAPADKDVVILHIINTFEWAPILGETGQSVPEWWAYEGISRVSFEAFVDTYDLEALAPFRGFTNGSDLRNAVLSGNASLNVLLSDALPVSIGQLEAAADDTVQMGLRAWAKFSGGFIELDARNTLAAVKQVGPSLDGHPIIASAIADISTSDITIHVRFIYWKSNETNAANETDKGSFEPIPAGSKIGLYKHSAPSVYTVVNGAEDTVVDNGQVALNVAREDLVVGNGEALIFRAEVPSGTVFERQYQHERRPRLRSTSITYGLDTDAWITYERPSADESITSLDFLATLESTALGSTEQPVEYYMGIPIFIQVQYPVVYTTGAGASANFDQVTRKAPKGLRLEFVSSGFTLGEFYTDEHGQIWGMLLQANESDTAIDITIQYEISDPTIGLPALEGEVLEGGPPITQYTANKDFYTDTPFFSSWNAGIGKPQTISMATLQVGLVETGGSAVSEFSSTDGRHAGLLHAFQQVRYIHQWFHYLTQGFTFGTNPDGTPKDESWEQILDNHDQNGTGKVYIGTPNEYSYDIRLPKIRVTTPRSIDPATGNPDINEGVTGEVSYINAELATGLRWWLILYGFDAFKMNQSVQVPDGSGGLILKPINELDNKAQFWRVHTIWHEFTHAVINMAIERLFNLDMSGSQTAAKDASTSGRLDQIIFDTVDAAGNKILSGGWSTLEEGLAAIPELALHEKATGKTPHFHPVPPASPRYLFIDTDASGTVDGTVNPATDLNLSQGTSINLNLGSTLPVLYDRRISLRVPIAFTWALWSGLKDTGGFNTTLLSQVTGNVPLNDLTDAVAYLDSTHLPQARQIFQALFWGPLIGMRPATRHVSPPPQWSDINGPANGPTTFSFMQMIETQFWAGLSPSDKTKLKELFEDANNPESYYLWFNFT